jgi:hypothetical protein
MPATSSSPRTAGGEPPAAGGAAPTVADVLVYVAIVAGGAMHYVLALRSGDFFTGDTTYFELAQSILSHGVYGFNSQPETVLPPGFPAIMAALCATVGCRYPVFVHAVVVFSTLGFLASYELLRRMEGRAAGAVICLLLISSPLEFAQETRMVFSDLPYLFTSTLVLLLVWRLDEQCTAPDAKPEGTN